jgi:outer membrane lipopolysaccharide assembly protein LptE/RlpB
MRSVIRAAYAVVVAMLVSGCGYALAGKSNNVPEYVKRIGVPAFLNQTSTSELDRIFTDAVTAEFQSRGRFTIVPSATGVDAVLTGTIQTVELTPTAFSSTQQALKYALTVVVTGEFKEIKDNKVVWTQSVRSEEAYEVPAGAAVTTLSTLFIQDRNAFERLAKTFARQLVQSILDAY